MTTNETYEGWMDGSIGTDDACNLMADALQAEENAEAARVAKLAELDSKIESLHAELDATPNRSWQSVPARFRLSLLIDYTAKRHLLSL